MAKDKQLNLRVSQDQLDLIAVGAQRLKMSRTAFVMAAAEQMARNALTKDPISYTQSDGRSKPMIHR